MSNMPTAKQRMRLQALSAQLFGVSSRWKKILDTSRIPTADGYRSPTLDEVLNALEQNFEVSALAALPQNELIETLAKGFVSKALGVRLSLTVTEESKQDFEDMLLLVPEELRAELQALVSPTPVPGSFSVVGTDFLGEVVYVLKPEMKEPGV